MECRIRISGHQDSSWQEWLAQLKITHESEGEKGTTMLSGPVRDQAELYGVLLTIRHLGLSLLQDEGCTVGRLCDHGQIAQCATISLPADQPSSYRISHKRMCLK